MDFKRETTELQSIVEILREQLTDTLRLGAHVQDAEAHFRDQNSGVPDLLKSMSRELWTISESIDCRASACGHKVTSMMKVPRESIQNDDDDSNLESLLNRFCRYARNTSERLVVARKWNDRETVLLLDHIRSVADTSIWFLDIYSNAVWLKCRLSPLPKWKPVSALRQIAS
jgi:DNA-binding ferritin-like protein